MTTKTFEQLLKDRPETFDGYDCQERKPLSEDYQKRVLPDHIQKRIAERQAKRPATKQAAE